jgi:hypothetical protein
MGALTPPSGLNVANFSQNATAATLNIGAGTGAGGSVGGNLGSNLKALQSNPIAMTAQAMGDRIESMKQPEPGKPPKNRPTKPLSEYMDYEA